MSILHPPHEVLAYHIPKTISNNEEYNLPLSIKFAHIIPIKIEKEDLYGVFWISKGEFCHTAENSLFMLAQINAQAKVILFRYNKICQLPIQTVAHGSCRGWNASRMHHDGEPEWPRKLFSNAC